MCDFSAEKRIKRKYISAVTQFCHISAVPLIEKITVKKNSGRCLTDQMNRMIDLIKIGLEAEDGTETEYAGK